MNDIYFKDIDLSVKLGEGKYREVFCYKGKAVKFLKQRPNNKNKVDDFNELEYENYCNFIEKVPLKFKINFAIIEWTGKINGKSASISDLIINDDGSVARSIAETGKIKDEFFWATLEKIEDLLIDSDIPLLDIRGENIIAQKIENRFNPVFIDFKRFGANTYPFQPWLRFKYQRMKKIQRRFRRMKEIYSC